VVPYIDTGRPDFVLLATPAEAVEATKEPLKDMRALRPVDLEVKEGEDVLLGEVVDHFG
jgi:hypothetical protein